MTWTLAGLLVWTFVLLFILAGLFGWALVRAGSRFDER